MRKIRKGDNVVVIAGKDKGKRGAVMRVLDENFLLVEGADHFFEGKLPIMREAIAEWLPRHFPALNLQQRA